MVLISRFGLEQAAAIAGISERRARYWARKQVLVPHVLYKPDVHPQQFVYDYTDLVGLRTLGLLRDDYHLSLQHLRKAHVYLRQHADRPWSSLRFWVAGKELLFSDPGRTQLQSASRPGQTAIAIEIAPVERSVRRSTQALMKRSPADIGKTERKRNVLHNQLVVKGTRVPVTSIVELSEDGYGVAEIVRAFPSVSAEDVTAILSASGQRGAA